MRPEEWFAVALRVLGVVGLNYGLWNLLDALLLQLGYFSLLDTSPGYLIVVGFVYLLTGLYLIRGAPHLLRFAYPEASEYQDTADEEQEAD